MNELALFAGAGGGILGGLLMGWRTVCAVELDTYAASVLIARQNDGLLEPFPVWDDVRTFDGRPWHGIVDVVSGGFPCQDISVAGKGAGIDGERSGLWVEMARIIREVEPRYVLVENSPMLIHRGLGKILGDLATMGYDARWGVFSACSIGATHTRERLFVLAHADRDGLESTGVAGNAGATRINGTQKKIGPNRGKPPSVRVLQAFQPISDDGTIGKTHGVANRVDRLKSVGNGQVPAVVRLAWNTLTADPLS